MTFFLFAYIKTLNILFDKRRINLQFTSDLRKYIENRGTLCNLSGSFSLNINIKKGDGEEILIKDIHNKVKKQKENKQDLCGTLNLIEYYEKNQLSVFLKRYANLRTGNFVDLTNFGVIDPRKVVFEDNIVKDCVFYSAVQRNGCFQIAASIYN